LLLRTGSYSLKASSPITQVAPLVTSRLTAAIAVTVLTGWIAQIDLLKNFAPGMIAMNPFTAGGLLAASIALLLRQPIDAPKERRIVGQLLAGAIIAMGGLNLLVCSHSLVGPSWLVLPLLADGSPVEVNGARISLSFVLIGAAILSLDWKFARGFRPAEAASAVPAIIAILSLVAYSHYLTGFYTTSTYTPASLLTSISFFLIATGILLARADRGTLAIIVSETAAGMLARRLIPLAILLPILIGALRQTAERAGLYDPIFGAAHSATTFMVVFFAAIWWTTRMLFRIDTNRMLAEGARQKQEEQMRQLNIEKIAAEKASQAKDDFLAILSHELRTPLTPALISASYLAEHEELSPQLREEVTAIRTSVQLEARLIDDLLDLTRITRGKIELHLEVVDAHGLLRNSIEIARDNILQKQLELVVDFGADRHHVWADAVRLQQVFWNLINNAVKFTKKNGRITIRTVNENGRFVFQITDSGVGIAPDQLDRIFRAFEQGERSISRRFGGLGLGLTISKRLLELQGGTITVHSEGLNRGASFKLGLASVESPKTASVSRSIGDEAPARSLQLLVVEDHPQTLRVLAALLRKQGHKVLTAECAQAAIKLLEAEHFDGLISDIGLPDGNGCDVMRVARQRQSLVGIALSGFGMEEDVRRSMDAGFEHHLTKPIDFQELEKFVGTMAERTNKTPP
jgi:signal transduction histidine kinase/ActR/RegA family two-component response regulator